MRLTRALVRTTMSNADAAPPSFFPALAARFTALIWSLLDAGLAKSGLFYAERYFALDDTNHDARHLYATALLRALQTHSALFLVNHREDAVPCRACYEIKAQCCEKLGRHRQAHQALARAAQVPVLGPSRAYYILQIIKLIYSICIQLLANPEQRALSRPTPFCMRAPASRLYRATCPTKRAQSYWLRYACIHTSGKPSKVYAHWVYIILHSQDLIAD